MMRLTRKFNSLEEVNDFLQNGKTVYSLAKSGNIWFLEYNDAASSLRDKLYKTLDELNSSNNNEESVEEIINKLIGEKTIETIGCGEYRINDSLKFRSVMCSVSKKDLEIIRGAFPYSASREIIDDIIKNK